LLLLYKAIAISLPLYQVIVFIVLLIETNNGITFFGGNTTRIFLQVGGIPSMILVIQVPLIK
jgi:hypothetical protein